MSDDTLHDRTKRVAQRAYELWDQQGRPDGRHHEHWLEAERQLDSEAGNEPSPSAEVNQSEGSLTAGPDGSYAPSPWA